MVMHELELRIDNVKVIITNASSDETIEILDSILKTIGTKFTDNKDYADLVFTVETIKQRLVEGN